MSALRHPDWHVFAEQRFRRRAAVATSRQSFRGEPYIVLSDRVTGQHLRLHAGAQDLWRMLDGRRTAQEIWTALMRRPANAPSQAELVEWLMHLVGAGLVLSDHDLDARHLSDRAEKKRSSMIEQRAASPLAIKIRLFDPDPIVRATWPFMRPLFTRAGGVGVAILLIVALVLAVMNLPALMGGLDALFLSQLGLLSLALAYPAMKAVHELAHCYALHAFGGRVREFGVMLLIFFPVPYVEASEATALPDKRARMLVGAAGILAELSIAAVALLIWLQLEPGVERAIVFNFVLIGSVSTLLFNGNPLLKFDAYYVLADWLEMPNLAQRAGDFLGDRFIARVTGLRQEEEPPPDEARILATYGTLALLYRVFLTLTIALIVSQWFFVIGAALAVWAVVMGLAWPMMKLAKKGARRATEQNRRRGAALRLAVFLAVGAGFVTLVPLPFAARGEGQIVPDQGARIVAETSGLLEAVFVADGATVTPAAPVARLADPELSARLDVLEVSLAFLSEAAQRPGLGPGERQSLDRELRVARETRADAEARQAALTIRAPIAGRLVWAEARAPVPGAFVTRGDVLGHVVADGALEMPIALPAAYSGLARDGALVRLRLPDGTELALPVARERVVDTGGQLPAALTVSGGGPVPEQPGAPGRALDAAWIVWVTPDRDLSAHVGMRFDVRMDLGRATLAEQAIFQARRLLVRIIRV
ncbi:HlyD family efflux transporter periplasmic adaptor subunit [Roseicyclus sp.]